MLTSCKLLIAMCSTGFLFGCASNATNTVFGSSDPISSSLKSMIDTAHSLYNSGRKLHRESRLTAAEQHYQQALRLDPSHMDAQNALAAIEASRGDLETAIKLLSNLAETYPEAAHVHANLGYAYYLKGQYPLAQEALERATMLDPSNENAWSKLNLVISEMNRQEMLLHRLEDDKHLVKADDAMDIKSVMPGVYTMHYPDEQRSLKLTTQVPLPPLRSVADKLESRVELVNGNGVNGLARALRGVISDEQWKIVRTRNNKHFGVKFTRIEYTASYYPAARSLADSIGVDAVCLSNNHQEGSNLRLVLGHDFKSVEPLRQRLAGASALVGT